MAGNIQWFRWHHGSVTDPKFKLIAHKAKQSLATVIAVWAFLLEQASASDERGAFGDVDCESLDCLLGLDDGATAAIMLAMEGRGLVEGGSVSAWEKRQPKRERVDENSTERSRAFRQKKRQETPEDNDATPSNATQHQETPRVEKRREEEKTEEAPSAKSPRGTALPEAWTLPDDWKTWAEGARPDVDVLTVADSFRDYWVAKPGKDGRKADWLATWRNWVRNQRSGGNCARPQSAEAVGVFV